MAGQIQYEMGTMDSNGFAEKSKVQGSTKPTFGLKKISFFCDENWFLDFSQNPKTDFKPVLNRLINNQF